MIRHVVVLSGVEDVTEDQVQAVLDGLRELPALIPEIRAYHLGPDLRLSMHNADFAIVADFDDDAAFRVYDRHPVHEQVRLERIRPILAGRSAVQFRLD